MYPIYNSWTLDGFQFFALILNPLILSTFWTNAIHLKERNSTNTRPAVVWNHVESTSVLNFIFSLEFIFRFFLSCHQAVRPPKHSLSWSFRPRLAAHRPVFLKQVFLHVCEVHSCCLLSFAFIPSPSVLRTHTVLWSLLHKRHMQACGDQSGTPTSWA